MSFEFLLVSPLILIEMLQCSSNSLMHTGGEMGDEKNLQELVPIKHEDENIPGFSIRVPRCSD